MSVRTAVKTWMLNRCEVDLRENFQMSTMGRYAENDVFIVGYPKSGNTWVQYLLSAAKYGVDPSRVKDSLVQRLVPDIYYHDYYIRWQDQMEFKSHEPPSAGYRNVIYLLRDGRDVMASYIRFLSKLHGDAFDLNKMLRTGKAPFPYQWPEHVAAWLANPYDARMLVIRYESLKEDCARELESMCRFLGVDCPTEECQLIAERASFDRMKARELRNGWANQEWPANETFCGKGEVGGFRQSFEEHDLDGFMERAGPVLRQCGYLDVSMTAVDRAGGCP
ncbi:MAG: sulfotransferase domain-containing protein [Lentisphaerae bacterium]|nr:sulfotransferase domain-containing protein [Lentisphaerota bacterium]